MANKKINKLILTLATVVTLSTSSLSFSMNLLKNVANFFGFCMKSNNTQQRDSDRAKQLDSGIVQKMDSDSAKQRELVEAIKSGDADTVKKFAEDKTFDISKSIKYDKFRGLSPIHFSCFYRNEKIVELLLKTDAINDINKVIEDGIYKGLTPLTLACCYCNEKTVELLLEHGAIKDINKPIKDGMYKGHHKGWTPLAIACYYYEKIVNLLKNSRGG